MNSRNDNGVVAGLPSGQTSRTKRLRGLAITGFIAALTAMAATTLAAALAQAVGVDFEVGDGSETIPLAGFTMVTGKRRHHHRPHRTAPRRCDGDDPHPGEEPPHPYRLTIS